MYFDSQTGYAGQITTPYLYFYYPTDTIIAPQASYSEECVRPLAERKAAQEFKCRTCFKSFKTKATADSHFKNIHEKPVRVNCSKCGQVFSNKYTLKKHVMKNHPARPEIS